MGDQTRMSMVEGSLVDFFLCVAGRTVGGPPTMPMISPSFLPVPGSRQRRGCPRACTRGDTTEARGKRTASPDSPASTSGARPGRFPVPLPPRPAPLHYPSKDDWTRKKKGFRKSDAAGYIYTAPAPRREDPGRSRTPDCQPRSALVGSLSDPRLPPPTPLVLLSLSLLLLPPSVAGDRRFPFSRSQFIQFLCYLSLHGLHASVVSAVLRAAAEQEIWRRRPRTWASSPWTSTSRPTACSRYHRHLWFPRA
jgi:hypothetical protein